jgi:hypothetical protein
MAGACCRSPRRAVGYRVLDADGECLIFDDDGCRVFRTATVAMREVRSTHPGVTWQLERVKA